MSLISCLLNGLSMNALSGAYRRAQAFWKDFTVFMFFFLFAVGSAHTVLGLRA